MKELGNEWKYQGCKLPGPLNLCRFQDHEACTIAFFTCDFQMWRSVYRCHVWTEQHAMMMWMVTTAAARTATWECIVKLVKKWHISLQGWHYLVNFLQNLHSLQFFFTRSNIIKYLGAYGKVTWATDSGSKDLGVHFHHWLCAQVTNFLLNPASVHPAVMCTWWNEKWISCWKSFEYFLWVMRLQQWLSCKPKG